MRSHSAAKYLGTAQLRERWASCSHMYIERRLASDPTFPKPVKLGGRIRLWVLDQIEAYERRCAAGEAGKSHGRDCTTLENPVSLRES
jgi:hypothetical protein